MSRSQVLLIDDDKALLKALPEVLRLQLPEVLVDTVSTPADALRLMSQNEYAAVVSDIQMPGMDGLTLLTQLKKLRPNTPVLLMTAFDDRQVVIQALRGGAYDFIPKPIDTEYFILTLNRAIQVSTLTRQVEEQKIVLENHAQELEEAVQRAVAESQTAHRRLAFLAEASTLLASSLDYEATLARLARLAVLYLADYCVVDVVDEESQTLKCIGIAHVEREQEGLVRQLRRQYQESGNHFYPPMSVLLNKQSVLYAEINDKLLASSTGHPKQLELLRKLHPRAWMIVPLIAQEKMLGVLTFALTNTRRRYGPEELALAEDLTRRAALAVGNARLYDEAQQALRVRDQFLAIAAHELKTPMTSILGTSQLLIRRVEKDTRLDERDVRRLHLIAEQTRRLNRLTTSLLDLSRLEAGQLTLDLADMDVAALARRVVEEIKLTLDRHNLEFSGGEEPLYIKGDELRLEQVLQNLLHNAIKYSPEGGTVWVEVKRTNGEALITVSDEGIGIPHEALPRLFSRFYRADNPSTRQISGIGLGLYVVREIVRLHEGEVAVNSTEGQGSTFTVRLPLAQTPPAASTIKIPPAKTVKKVVSQ